MVSSSAIDLPDGCLPGDADGPPDAEHSRDTSNGSRPFSRYSAAIAHTDHVSPASLDFGYPWWLNYGHLLLFVVLLAVVLAARALRASRWVTVPVLTLSVWAASAALLVYLFGLNQVPHLPTQGFLESGTGRVLDLGAGTGRSSIMVLAERPLAKLVATDLFGASFAQHFGPGDRPQDRLAANLQAAGVDDRATIETPTCSSFRTTTRPSTPSSVPTRWITSVAPVRGRRWRRRIEC